jgi:hypothetical protein
MKYRSLFVCVALWSACSVPLYKVAPLPQNAPVAAGQTATANALEVTASALKEDDEAFDRFNANLPLAGLLVVDVKLVNRSAAPLGTLKFALEDATGKRFSPLDAKQQLKQMMKFDGVRLYAITGREETLEQLQAMALPKKLTLGAQEERRGVLFFHVKQDVLRLQGPRLLVQGSKPPLTLLLQ